MEIQVNLGKRKRRELAAAIGGILGAEVSYKSSPGYAYEVGSPALPGKQQFTVINKKNNTGVTQRHCSLLYFPVRRAGVLFDC